MQSALGIPEITWFANPQIPFMNQLVAAVGAVYSGQCDVVLGYHALFRGPMFSRSAARDPFRRRSGFGAGSYAPPPETIAGAVGYTAWASRYLHEFGVGREVFRPRRDQRALQRDAQPGRGDARPAHDGRLPRTRE